MMIKLTKFAEGYPAVCLRPDDILLITAANLRPSWSEGFYRDISRLGLRDGTFIVVTETLVEVEQIMLAERRDRELERIEVELGVSAFNSRRSARVDAIVEAIRLLRDRASQAENLEDAV